MPNRAAKVKKKNSRGDPLLKNIVGGMSYPFDKTHKGMDGKEYQQMVAENDNAFLLRALYPPCVVVERFAHAHEYHPGHRIRVSDALEKALSHHDLLHDLR